MEESERERTAGFVGLGITGLPASKNLMDAGYHLVEEWVA